MSALRIVFVNPIGACGAYREVFPGLALRDLGHQVTFVRKDDLVGPEMREADIVIFERVSHQGNVNCLVDAKRYAKVVHECDDNLHDLPATNAAHGLYGPGASGTIAAEQACRLADAVTTASDDLAQRYRQFNANITACSNAIPDNAFATYGARTITREFRRSGQIRIGWAGAGDYHQADLALVVEPLMRIMRAYPAVRVVLFGGTRWPMFAGFEDRIETHPTLPCASPIAGAQRDEQAAMDIANGIHQYYAALNALDLDIGLAPLEPNSFNASKSPLKVLECGFLGIPMVTSRWKPYEGYAHVAGSAILMAADSAEWEREIRSLIDNHDLRAGMAQRNRAHIGAQHRTSKAIGAWASLYEGLARDAGVAVRS